MEEQQLLFKMESKDLNLQQEFSEHFDLQPFYNRELRRKLLFDYIGEVIDRVRRINSYVDFIDKRNQAVCNFIRGSETIKKILMRKRNLEELLEQRIDLRKSYAEYWSFDYLIKEHPLVERCNNEIMNLLSGDSEKYAILATPGKLYCKEGQFDVVKHIAKTYLIHKFVNKNPEILVLTRFLDQVVYAEGKQDWELRPYFFDYAIFGLNLLRHLQLKGLYKGKDPLIWLNNLWFEQNV